MASTLYCPRCPQVALQHIELHGQELDHCPNCDGLWFDDEELSEAIRHKHGLTDDYCVRQGFAEPLKQHQYHCHRCDVPMQQFHLLKEYLVTVDSCPNCNGSWVDGGDVRQVLAAPKLQQALAILNQKVCRKSWLFQFFTQMPKEYNIKPHRTPWLTWSLVALNCLIYLLYGFNDAHTEWVFSHFAFISMDILQGQSWWGFISYQFLHGSLWHLFGNMYFLWIIGDNLEDALGRWRFLGLYLLCGIAAALVELAARVMVGQELLMVGASGAVAGLFGMYLLWFRHASLTFMFVVWQKKLSPSWYFALWVAMNIFGLLLDDMGVAYWAHLGGFVAGLMIGYSYRHHVLQNNPLLCLLQRPEARILR